MGIITEINIVINDKKSRLGMINFENCVLSVKKGFEFLEMLLADFDHDEVESAHLEKIISEKNESLLRKFFNDSGIEVFGLIVYIEEEIRIE